MNKNHFHSIVNQTNKIDHMLHMAFGAYYREESKIYQKEMFDVDLLNATVCL